MKPLQQLYCQADSYTDEKIIAYQKHGAINWKSFKLRVTNWQQELKDCDDQKVALYHSDTLEFAAALFALWRLNKTAIIPSSSLAHTITQLQTLTSTFIGEFSDSNIQQPNTEIDTSSEFTEKPIGDESSCAVIIFTSGSSGEPTPIEKTFSQLNCELQTLEKTWGQQLGNSTVTGTVSHHHIYGLLFRLLWPLCGGRAWTSNSREYWEDILNDCQSFDKLAIISSPAHLSRIPPASINACAWEALQQSTQIIFSSGAALASTDAQQAEQQLNQAVIEIYGSSETGGIAWRQQSKNSHWQTLANVSIQSIDSQLAVTSPHLPNQEWFYSADKCELIDDTHFILLGRTDRIVKISGKRISMNAIEKQLTKNPWVKTVKVISLPEKKDRLAAVVILNKEGNNALIDQGKKNINQQLIESLKGNTEAVAHPRYWRYLSELPYNNQGKSTLLDLQTLFDEDLQPRFPEVVRQIADDEGNYTLELYIPSDLYYFNGHFPGSPILPGVVQTHWAINYGERFFGELGKFLQLEALKFQNVILPAQKVTLTLIKKNNKLIFSYTHNEQRHSSGRAVFEST